MLLATSCNSPVLLLSPIGRSVVRFPVPSLQTAIDQDAELKIPPDGSAVGVSVCEFHLVASAMCLDRKE